jgi:hypothetical protein
LSNDHARSKVMGIQPPRNKKQTNFPIFTVLNKCQYLAQHFQLARSVATWLMKLQNARWLHKGFYPPTTHAKLPFSSPFITGFQFARPSGPAKISLPVVQQSRSERYWHPRLRNRLQGEGVQPRFRSAYDIHSFSLVLLGIRLL